MVVYVMPATTTIETGEEFGPFDCLSGRSLIKPSHSLLTLIDVATQMVEELFDNSAAPVCVQVDPSELEMLM